MRRVLVTVFCIPLGVVLACGRGSSVDAADATPSTTAATIDAAAALMRGPTDAAPAAPALLGALDAGTALDPFGHARASTRASCAALVAARHVADLDQKTSFVDGDDLLAIVNRSPTGQLAPDYAPSDLVDIRTGKPLVASDCEKFQCLRREAASALDELLLAMKKEGFPGHVESAFRSYGAQCGTFGNWSRKSSFCEATEQSALPGHSQHQLGTTVDMFTEEWAEDARGVFREGFGCTPAGKFLQEHATDFGYVMPYPIHPDDRHPRQKCVVRWDIPININPRTGYRFEHWHIRYVGKEPAARFKAALAASGPGKPTEITVEQWLRAEKGLGGADTELPVCDGCNCGACSTLSGAGDNACDKKGGALHLDEHGRAAFVDATPSISVAAWGKVRKWHGRVVDVKLDVPIGTITQTPIVGVDAVGYATGVTFDKLAPYPETEPRSFPPLAGAWVIGVEPIPNDTGVAWPYRAAIAASIHGQIYNRANLLLPTRGGPTTLKVPIPSGVQKAKVVLMKGGIPYGQERSVEGEEREK
jgi:D-alanyl-D-alanine carboxypeptidase